MLTSLNVFAQKNPVRVGIVGLVHNHVQGFLGREEREDIKIVGIVETNHELALRYSKQFHFPMSLIYNSMKEMIDATHPEAVRAFGTIYDHLAVVEACAPRGIHVMVKKPLAVNMEHARKMETLAKKYRIHLLTNYETTWYASNHKAYELLRKDTIGSLRKVIVHDGHRGPRKLGINSEFLDWLTDPVLDGGGAIVDFGCYGVNLTTWLMNGKRPNTVTAVTQQLQHENNPKVDDESTIILTYDSVNSTIQGSWNWPMGRKDMEVYGLTGAIYADNGNNLRVRMAEGYSGYNEKTYQLKNRETPFNDPFAFFAAVIRNEISLEPNDLSSLENNMTVVEILDAARLSARTGRTIHLRK